MVQAVFDLDDGSALFVTVAKYQTPSHADIDHAGIKPDSKCSVPALRVGEQNDVPISIRAVGVWQVSALLVDYVQLAAPLLCEIGVCLQASGI